MTNLTFNAQAGGKTAAILLADSKATGRNGKSVTVLCDGAAPKSIPGVVVQIGIGGIRKSISIFVGDIQQTLPIAKFVAQFDFEIIRDVVDNTGIAVHHRGIIQFVESRNSTVDGYRVSRCVSGIAA